MKSQLMPETPNLPELEKHLDRVYDKIMKEWAKKLRPKNKNLHEYKISNEMHLGSVLGNNKV
jgi:hypothetical protein